jgi:hypothetical protein
VGFEIASELRGLHRGWDFSVAILDENSQPEVVFRKHIGRAA